VSDIVSSHLLPADLAHFLHQVEDHGEEAIEGLDEDRRLREELGRGPLPLPGEDDGPGELEDLPRGLPLEEVFRIRRPALDVAVLIALPALFFPDPAPALRSIAEGAIDRSAPAAPPPEVAGDGYGEFF
jgi:hypothetical protein